MKQIILSMVITLTAMVVTAQTDIPQQTANDEAANWKTWLLDNPWQIEIAAPPGGVQ